MPNRRRGDKDSGGFELPWVPFWLGAPVAAAGAFAIVALGVSQRAGGAPLLPDPTDG